MTAHGAAGADAGRPAAREVTVVGVGRMGLPITARLAAAGHVVSAFDVRPDAQAGAEAAGARWRPDLRHLRSDVASAPMVVTVLPGSPELRQLMLDGQGGAPGLLRQLAPGALWIDMTSAAPDLGAELADVAEGRAVRYVDAAIGGGPAEAQQGRLRLYLGGAADDVTCARSLLLGLGAADRLRHMGGHGAGYLSKLLINQLWFGQAIALAEALSLATAAGLDPASFADALPGSPADSAFVRDHLPRLLSGDPLPSFGLDRVVEELDSLQRAAARNGTPWSVSDAVAQVHRVAFERFGPVDGELLAAGQLLR